MNRSIRNLNEILSQGGCIMSSEWTTGSGRYITARAIPPMCKKLYAEEWDAGKLRGLAGKTYKKIRQRHPLVKYVIAITDMRAAKAAIRKALGQ